MNKWTTSKNNPYMTSQWDYFCGSSVLRGILFLEGCVAVKICLVSLSLFTLRTTSENPFTFILLGWKHESKSLDKGTKTFYKCLKIWVTWLFEYIVKYSAFDWYGSSGIYLTKETSINIRDPKLPEVGQLTNHHIWQLLHKLHLLWGFKVPSWNKDTHILQQVTDT